MSALTPIQQLNRDLGDRVLAEAQQNPQAYPGKYVGITNGQVVIVARTLVPAVESALISLLSNTLGEALSAATISGLVVGD